MNKTILIPNFTNVEPNLTSTRKKNEEGKCRFHHCNNPLPKEEYRYMSFLACSGMSFAKVYWQAKRDEQDVVFRDGYLPTIKDLWAKGRLLMPEFWSRFKGWGSCRQGWQRGMPW